MDVHGHGEYGVSQQTQDDLRPQCAGSERFGPPHRTVKNVKGAVSGAGGSFVSSEFNICFGFRSGPHGSHGNAELLKGAAREIFANFDENFILFEVLYERLTRSRNNGALPVNFGSHEHRRWLWWDIKEDQFCSGKLTGFNAGRWMDHEDKHDHYEASLDVMLFLILYVLLTRGTISDFKQVSLLASIIGPNLAENGVPLPVQPEDLSLETLKQAAKENEARLRSGGASLLVVAQVLANTTSRKLELANVHIPRPVYHRMMSDITTTSTQRGRTEFLIYLACGKNDDVFSSVFRSLSDATFIRKMGFITRSEVRGPESIREDNVVAAYCLDLARRVVAKECESSSFYTDRPPYNWMRTFSGDASDKEFVNQFNRDANAALGVLEPLYETDKFAKDLVDACLWPHSPFVKEGLTEAREMNYTDLGPQTRNDLLHGSRGPGVKLIEDQHRALNATKRQHQNGKMSRHSRWHTARTSGLMESYDIAQPEATTEMETTAKRMTLNIKDYETAGKPFSMGLDDYNKLLTKDSDQ